MPAPGQHVFSEKVALVTDAASPIGRAVSMQLGLYGCFVIAAVSAASEGERNAVDELKTLGTLAHSFDADTSTAKGAAALIDSVGEVYGRLDLLVNCLSAPDADRFATALDEDVDSVLNAVIKPAYLLTRESIRLAEGRPSVRVVNVVTNRERGEAGEGMFVAAANSAVESLTRSLADHLPPKFRINAVSVTEREMPGGDLDRELFRPRSSVDPDDVARAVVYLLSSESKGVSGHILRIG